MSALVALFATLLSFYRSASVGISKIGAMQSEQSE